MLKKLKFLDIVKVKEYKVVYTTFYFDKVNKTMYN